MKFSCTRENLYQGLSITSRVGGKNVNLPILSNVLLKADGGGVRLVATNLEIAITCSIRAHVEQQGEYTVPSKLFFDYVSLLPNDRVDIDLIDDAIFVKSAKAKTKIKGMVASEFPLIPPVQGGEEFSVSVSDFSDALSRVLFAAATNESRPELAGVLLSFNGDDGKGSFVLAATDSYRLAEVVTRTSSGSEKAVQVIVPQRTLAELLRIISVFRDDVEAPVAVKMVISDNQIVFQYAGVELTSRIIEGVYPDYRQIIPQSAKTTSTLAVGEYVQGAKTASLFSKTGLYDVHVNVDATQGLLELTGSDSARGENTVTLEGKVEGENNAMTLNYRYLLDGLNALGSESVIMKMIDAASPCVLEPLAKDERKYRYIVMPIRQ